MTWLDRVIAVECRAHDGQVVPAGRPCARFAETDADRVFCASRIQAAERAATKAAKKPRQHRVGAQLRNPADTMGLKWRAGHGVFACKNCDALINFNGRETEYSRDNGVTWTPDDACPGRTTSEPR